MNKSMIAIGLSVLLAACSGAPEEGTPDEPTDAVTVEGGTDPLEGYTGTTPPPNPLDAQNNGTVETPQPSTPLVAPEAVDPAEAAAAETAKGAAGPQ